MKYMPAIDIQRFERAIREGQIRLQVGQRVSLCQQDQPWSRFHHVSDAGVLVAFHGDTATQRFRRYVEQQRQQRVAHGQQELVFEE